MAASALAAFAVDGWAPRHAETGAEAWQWRSPAFDDFGDGLRCTAFIGTGDAWARRGHYRRQIADR